MRVSLIQYLGYLAVSLACNKTNLKEVAETFRFEYEKK